MFVEWKNTDYWVRNWNDIWEGVGEWADHNGSGVRINGTNERRKPVSGRCGKLGRMETEHEGLS